MSCSFHCHLPPGSPSSESSNFFQGCPTLLFPPALSFSTHPFGLCPRGTKIIAWTYEMFGPMFPSSSSCLLTWLEFGAGSAPTDTVYFCCNLTPCHSGFSHTLGAFMLIQYYVISHNNHPQNPCYSLSHFKLLQQQRKSPTASQLTLNSQPSQTPKNQIKPHLSCATPFQSAPLNTSSFFHFFQLLLPC